MWWDWESPIAANVTATAYEFNVKGLLFDNRTNETDPAGVAPPAGMPAKDMANPAKLQGFLSTYMLDSAFDAGLSVYNNASIWVNSSDVSDHGVYPFNTSNVEELLPGIESYYGPNVPVNIRLNLKKIDDVLVSEADQKCGAKFTLQVEFWVITRGQGPEKAAAITLVDTAFEFTALVQNMTLSMQLHKVNVDKITADMCTFGKLHTLTIKIALNSGFTFGMGTINKILAKHTIAIPSKIGKYFELSDLTIGYHDDFLALGLTPTFIGPTTPKVFTQ